MDDDAELYDEFGNLIGDAFDSDAEILEKEQNDRDNEMKEDHDGSVDDFIETEQKSVARPQDVAPIAETMVAKPFAEENSEAVIEPLSNKKFKVDFTESDEVGDSEKKRFESLPKVFFSREYMVSTMKMVPERIRNIALVGNTHSGKTSFLDIFVLETHGNALLSNHILKHRKPLRFTDNSKLEIERGLTTKLSPMTLLLEDENNKSFVMNFVDTPGHVDFSDEVTAALETVDGVVLVIDALEGLTFKDKNTMSDTMKKNLPLAIIINKIDRLILELNLPVVDFYYKLKYLVDDVNSFICNNEFKHTYSWSKAMDPTLGNIVFASASLGFCFTLQSFAELYFAKQDMGSIEAEQFSKTLWGDTYFEKDLNQITYESNNGRNPRAFNTFVAEPLYKLFTYTLVSDGDDERLVSLLWKNFRLSLPKEIYKLDAHVVLKEIMQRLFKSSPTFTNVVTRHIPSPMDTPAPYNSPRLEEHDGGFLAKVTKLIEYSSGEGFYAMLRVFEGQINVGDKVKVLGLNFEDDEEDYKIEVVEGLFVPSGRYKFPITTASEGCVVLASGIDSIITKGAIICNCEEQKSKKFGRTHYDTKSVFKVAVEPSNPSDLPKLLDGLRKLNKSYLACVIKVEESGEHVIFGPGELYMDCMLHDLRNVFTDDLEIRVSDPMTKFSETCIGMPATKIAINSPSGKFSISVSAEPLDDIKVSKAIENGIIDLNQPLKSTAKTLRKDFGWDALASRSLWCFGPEDVKLPSLLLDDTLEAETDKRLLYSLKDSINLGFKWAIDEGPLCDEPIRNTKFKILDASFEETDIHNNASQVLPTARRACYTGFMLSSPRLMEPIYSVFATCTSRATSSVERILHKRRGKVLKVNPIVGTSLNEVEGYVPVIDSVGFETDLRLLTQGQAMCFLDFKKWDIVPGNPLDEDCDLPQLTPVPYESTARDFVLKTRKRKGLTGEPSLKKYVEAELYAKLRDIGIVD